MADRYLVSGAGTKLSGATSSWSATNGGAGGASVPGSGDNVFLTSTSGTGTLEISLLSCYNFDCNGYTGTITGSWLIVYGAVFRLATGMTTSMTGTLSFSGSVSCAYTCNGKSVTTGTVIVNGATATVVLQDNFISGGGLQLTTGTFNANNKNVTVGWFASTNSNTRTLTMGSGTWIINGSTDSWDLSTETNMTLNCNTSTIRVQSALAAGRFFVGGSFTYNKIELAHTGAFPIRFRGASVFAEFKVLAGRIVEFEPNKTVTATTWVLTGTEANPITIRSESDGATNHTLAKAGGGTVEGDWLNIKRSTASPANTFYAIDSVDSGNNENWAFTGRVTLTFNGNSQSYGTVRAPALYVNPSNVTLNEYAVGKIDKALVGWNTKADGTGTLYKIGSTFNITESTTLYADWKDPTAENTFGWVT